MSIWTVALLFFEIILFFAIPIVALVIVYKKTKENALPALWGGLAFLLFVMGLENLLHQVLLVFVPATSQFIYGHPWVYVAYGALAAGIFEETARLLVMKFLMKKQDCPSAALMYGIGHGGVEMYLVGALSILNSAIFAFFIVTGTENVIYESLSGDSLVAVKAAVDSVRNLSVGNCLWGVEERIGAFLFHIALSVIVFYGVKNRKYYWYVIAFLLHAIGDVPAACAQIGILKSVPLVEGLMVVVIAVTIGVAFVLYKKENNHL